MTEWQLCLSPWCACHAGTPACSDSHATCEKEPEDPQTQTLEPEDPQSSTRQSTTPSEQMDPPWVISGDKKADPHCSSTPTPEKVKLTDPDTPEVKTVGVNLANCSSVVYEAWCNIPGVKTVNELAEEKWTPVVKRKEEVRQLKKGDDTQRLNPLFQVIKIWAWHLHETSSTCITI